MTDPATDRPTRDHVRVRAPGRVNLIGDHTDYNDGYCLPVALPQACRIRAVRSGRGDATWRATSAQEAGVAVVGRRGTPVGELPAWGRFLGAALTEAFAMNVLPPPGAVDLAIDSDIPVGAGLSSSAALCVALGLVLDALGDGPRLEDGRLVDFAHAVEVEATGVPCGFMDQLASVHGRADHALLLDLRDRSVHAILWPEPVTIVVAHCGVARRVEESEYAKRRAACLAAAKRLGVPALRDATAAQVADDPVARHVVSENARVLAFADALGYGNGERMGKLMLASHASLRDDFRVSTPQLDALVDAFTHAGAWGARLTGAGFGGCVVAVTRTAHAARTIAATIERYRADTGIETEPFTVRPAGGVEVLDD